MNCLTHILTCPVCSLHLTQLDHTWKCANGHTFDISKEGYVNLALGKWIGDTKAMLQARRDFLERGHYQPLADALNDIITNYLHTQEQATGVLPHLNLLDVGCGEGYYVGHIQQHLNKALPNAEYCMIGLDISKDAMRMAAKRYQQAHFVVANLKERLVFANDSLHILLNIFAPRNVAEFARVLMLGGIAIVVLPTPTHLEQLRSTLHLLQIEEHKQQKVIDQFASHFTLLHTKDISYQLPLNQSEIEHAVMMTPNSWHITDETRQSMQALGEIETTVSFTCLVFQKLDRSYEHTSS